MNFTLNNRTDAVKEHCLKPRNELSLESEIAIKKIQDERDEIIKELDEYQTNILNNFIELDQVEKKNFESFIDELKIFHTEWKEYLKKYQINETELIQANKLALELVKRFKKEKLNLDKLIFNKKSIKFHKNHTKSHDFCFGNLEYNNIGGTDFNAKEEIDFNKFQVIKISNILIDSNNRDKKRFALIYLEIEKSQ